jgi:WD40 repeat protein
MVRLWDVRDESELGQPLHVPGNRDKQVSVAFSPDGGTFVTAGRDVRIWDARSHSQRGAPFGRGAGPVAFSPDGHTIAAGGTDGKVRLWDSRTRKQLGRPLDLRDDRYQHAEPVASVLFNPNGRTIVASSEGGVRMWDARTHAELRAPFEPRDDPEDYHPDSLAFSHDGSLLAGNGFLELRFWDTRRQRAVAAPKDEWANSIAFSPEGRILASGGLDGALRLFNVRTRHQIGQPLRSYPTPFEAVAFSPDGHTVAAGTDAGDVWLWDTSSNHPTGSQLVVTNDETAQAICDGPAGCGYNYITSLGFGPDAKTVTAVNDWPSATTWDVASHQQLGETGDLGIGQDDSAILAFSSDGRTTAVAENPYMGPPDISFWRPGASVDVAATGSPIDDADVASLALSPDGRVLAAGGYWLWIWDTETNNQMAAKWDDPTKSRLFKSLACTPDDRTLAGGGSDGTISFWDPWAHKQLGPPLQASRYGAITSVAYSPDGKLLATASDDWTIRLWDSQTHREIGLPLQDSGPVESIAFSPDGEKLVSASLADVRLWDTATQTQIADLETTTPQP